MELIWDLVVVFRNCVFLEMSNSWELSNFLFMSCWIKKIELLKVRFCVFLIILNLFGRRFVFIGYMLMILRKDKLFEGILVNVELIMFFVLVLKDRVLGGLIVIMLIFVVWSFLIKVFDKGELFFRRR